MKKLSSKYTTLLIISIVYSLYYYLTRENFTGKIIESLIVFAAVFICFLGYDYFKKRAKE